MKSRLGLICTACLLTACTVGPDYHPPKLPVSGNWERGNQVIRMDGQTVPAKWWTIFDDTLLDNLVERALHANHNLRIARARAAEARALRGEARADLFPTITANAQSERIRTSRNDLGADEFTTNLSSHRYQLGFDAAWELDFFGRNQRSLEAATADLNAQLADLAALHITMAAEVARNYIELKGVQARKIVAEKTLTNLHTLAELTNALIERGVINNIDLMRINAEIKTREAGLFVLTAEVEQTIHGLSVLIGEQPMALNNELNQPAPIPFHAKMPAIAVPALVLRKRPDIMASERELAAATARIGVVTAELYPRITLMGDGGYLSASTGKLIERQSLFGSIGPQFHWPPFDGGRIRAQVAAADARAQQALVRFEQVVLRALEETETALSAWHRGDRRADALRSAHLTSRNSARITKQRYEAGLESFIHVLDAQRSSYDAEDAYTAAQVEVGVALIAVLKATAEGINNKP